MQKKIVNWYGYLLIGLYILILIVLFITCLLVNRTGNISVRNIIYSITTGWSAFILPLIYLTLNRTWYKVLPEIRIPALIRIKGWVATTEIVSDTPFTVQKPACTFELPDNRTLTFKIPNEAYKSLEQNDTGVLVYKHQGRWMFFVRFEKQTQIFN